MPKSPKEPKNRDRNIDANDIDLRAVYVEAFNEALNALAEAARELVDRPRELTPVVALPRPRIFKLAPGVTWPRITPLAGVAWANVTLSKEDSRGTPVRSAGRAIANAAEWQPRKTLHAIRQIEAATEWCHRRLEGLERQAEHILKEQAEANGELLAHAVEKEL